MIELGSMEVRDAESIIEVRSKVLGVVRSFARDEIVATRAATAISEASRECLTACGVARIDVEIDHSDEYLTLRLKIHTGGPPPDTARLGRFFQRVSLLASGSEGGIAADLLLPRSAAVIDPALIERERARMARKSRNELLEEVRAKNRELEAHNERLEATVAERTAQLRSANVRMQRDLDAGAAYVRALIPAPVYGPLSIDWRYVPSSDLGGDTIGYHWLDADHLALYLIDVTGHGLDSALLAVAITNVIRSATLPGVNMKRPDQVVVALNEAFQGVHHNLKYFTIWYGVYEQRARQLTWSGGGHHPAALFVPGRNDPMLLPASGPLMGAVQGMEFPADSCTVPQSARLLLFSDGAFEILRDGKVVWNLQDMLQYLANRGSQPSSLMDDLLEHARQLRGEAQLEDDFSIIEACFG